MTRSRSGALAAFALLSLLAAAWPAAPALARGGDDGRQEVRVPGRCWRGGASKLRLRQRDGVLEVRFEVERRRPGEIWRVAIVREGRVAWRGRVRTRAPRGGFEVERRLPGYPGANRVFARAVGPRGATCQATATLGGR